MSLSAKQGQRGKGKEEWEESSGKRVGKRGRQKWDKDQRGHRVSRKEHKPGALGGCPGVWREQ